MASEVAFDDLFPEVGKDSPKKERKPRGRAAKTTISKEYVKSVLEFANMGLAMSASQYALSSEEIESLADAWYAIIKEYPSVGKYLVVGKKLGVWGNLFFVHYQIFGPRIMAIADSTKARSARSVSGNDRKRQDNASGKTA